MKWGIICIHFSDFVSKNIQINFKKFSYFIFEFLKINTKYRNQVNFDNYFIGELKKNKKIETHLGQINIH